MIRAFVSSTYIDLKEHRQYVIDRLMRAGITVDPMEVWTAAGDEPKELSKERVRDCDICVLLVGFRRGFVPRGEERSITQMEFDEARSHDDMELLVFLAKEDAKWPIAYLEGLKRDRKLRAWREDLKQNHTVGFFGPEPPSVDVDSALLRWSEKMRSGKAPERIVRDDDSFEIRIRAYSNSNSVLVAWRTEKPIPGCPGFALHRKTLTDAGVKEDLVGSYAGFAGDSQAGVPKSSIARPIQKFSWVDLPPRDYDTRYRVVPMLGPYEALKETPDVRGGSGWTEWVSPRTAHAPNYRSFFNRVQPGRLRNFLLEKDGKTIPNEWVRLKEGQASASRDYFGGELRSKLLQLLLSANAGQQRVNIALSEIDDPDVIRAVGRLGKRASVILCRNPGNLESNRGAESARRAKIRKQLTRSGVRLYEFDAGRNGICRFNFAAFCDRWGAPSQVWVGSSGWSVSALCGYSNDGLLIESVELARVYLDRWESLRDRCCGQLLHQPKETRPVQVQIADSAVTLWNAAAPNDAPLADACRLIRGSREGVLFVLPHGKDAQTLVKELDKLSRDGLLVQGIVSLPTPKKGYSATLYDSVRGKSIKVRGVPRIGSSIVLVDPFGSHPVLITGGFWSGESNTGRTDLLIVENAGGLAAEQSVYTLGLFQSLRFRAFVQSTSRTGMWIGLKLDDSWQRSYFKQGRRTLDFLFGLISPGT